jgi:HK97 family phage prohead protease
MALEYKELQLKEMSGKGIFEGIACKYGNVDYAKDRLLKSAGKANHMKEVPILYQHNVDEVIGKGILTDGKNGIMLKANLFLDKDDSGNTIFPLAWKAYELAKKGLMKLSIGYTATDYDYKSESSGNIRELKEVNVMEVSTVLFPCNDQAVITDVKKLAESEGKEGEEVELKKEFEAFKQEVKEMLDPKLREEKALSEFNELKDKILSLSDEQKQEIKSLLVEKQDSKNDDIIDIEVKEQEFYKELENKFKDMIKGEEEK